MLAIDTNVIVRLLTNDDPDQAAKAIRGRILRSFDATVVSAKSNAPISAGLAFAVFVEPLRVPCYYKRRYKLAFGRTQWSH
ncbi:hypothetical protein M2323_004140 [Rhodoblastus acidophilus]|uniref:hypothetical protein n=1 Tax=Rhodoblastus acidophilus TaxID=1074 RepID=UPI0022253C29|nr:hypothetical protein [Rhodoblastus acidophilus]MCW2286299.1 hypothetical protein [Rhodoblastus acidophilus]MCW2335194.1 hypothetical protein [Rhodoblastus acidophilus]